MHICVKIFLEICVFISFGKISRCGSAGSEGSCTLCTFTLASSGRRSSGEMESHLLTALLSFLINFSACSIFMSRPHSGAADETALNTCLWTLLSRLLLSRRAGSHPQIVFPWLHFLSILSSLTPTVRSISTCPLLLLQAGDVV